MRRARQWFASKEISSTYNWLANRSKVQSVNAEVARDASRGMLETKYGKATDNAIKSVRKMESQNSQWLRNRGLELTATVANIGLRVNTMNDLARGNIKLNGFYAKGDSDYVKALNSRREKVYDDLFNEQHEFNSLGIAPESYSLFFNIFSDYVAHARGLEVKDEKLEGQKLGAIRTRLEYPNGTEYVWARSGVDALLTMSRDEYRVVVSDLLGGDRQNQFGENQLPTIPQYITPERTLSEMGIRLDVHGALSTSDNIYRDLAYAAELVEHQVFGPTERKRKE